MSNLPASQPPSELDPIGASFESLVVIAFPRSSSKSYDAAVAAASRAAHYAVQVLGKSQFHVAAFGKEKQQAAYALMLINLIARLKNVQIYSQGRQQLNAFSVQSVLDCYLSSLACDDWRAHCNVVIPDPFPQKREKQLLYLDINDPFTKKAPESLFPCAYLKQYADSNLKKNHPASVNAQIQAMGVKRGCEWCPNFKPDAFRKL